MIEASEPVSLRPHEVKAVFTSLVGERREASALSVARSTGLSTLVVVPALEHLCERGMVVRSERQTGSRGWVYQVTAAGRREMRASA